MDRNTERAGEAGRKLPEPKGLNPVNDKDLKAQRTAGSDAPFDERE